MLLSLGPLPPALAHGLQQEGLPGAAAEHVVHVPPPALLFAAFLGYHPMSSSVPTAVLHALQAHLLGKSFFPHLIAEPFMTGLRWAFYVSAGMCGIAAIASLLRGRH